MLKPDQTALILIDIQGKLAQLMHGREALFEQLARLIRGAKALGLPVLWLEQYPQGLGPTIPEVASLLPDARPVAKTSFSACGNADFLAQLSSAERRQVLLAGIEAHVCVYQTARDLLEAGYEVEVVADAVSSRTEANRQLGLQRMSDAGARLTSVEMALFELLRTAEAPAFKDIARIVK
jgi:nicotinamidase-related amidase